MAEISIVIPTYNGFSVLGTQLESLCEAVDPRACEIIVADNGSTDDTPDVARSFADRLPIRVIDASRRQGPGAARNDGVRSASGHIILFLDDDDAVSPLWFTEMVAEFNLTDAHLVSGGISFEFESRAGDALPQARHSDFLPYGVTANLGIRRDTFLRLGGFDESFTSNEDVDLCWRAQLAGYEFRFLPHATVFKRRRPGPKAAWRQHQGYGRAEARLFVRYRAHGMERGTRLSTKRWAWLVLHAPRALTAEGDRWVRVLGRQVGRIRGGLEHGIPFL